MKKCLLILMALVSLEVEASLLGSPLHIQSRDNPPYLLVYSSERLSTPLAAVIEPTGTMRNDESIVFEVTTSDWVHGKWIFYPLGTRGCWVDINIGEIPEIIRYLRRFQSRLK